jgi:hypothetical protein
MKYSGCFLAIFMLPSSNSSTMSKGKAAIEPDTIETARQTDVKEITVSGDTCTPDLAAGEKREVSQVEGFDKLAVAGLLTDRSSTSTTKSLFILSAIFNCVLSYFSTSSIEAVSMLLNERLTFCIDPH